MGEESRGCLQHIEFEAEVYSTRSHLGQDWYFWMVLLDGCWGLSPTRPLRLDLRNETMLLKIFFFSDAYFNMSMI